MKSRMSSRELDGNVLADCLQFMTMGVASVVRDEFTQCFEPKEEQPGWRVSASMLGTFWSWISHIRLTAYRYLVLLPFRLGLFLMASCVFFSLLPLAHLFPILGNTLFLVYCKCWMRAFGSHIRHHGVKPNLTGKPHVFVANHTSFIDYFVLSSYQIPHATVAQQHKGLMGLMQTYVLSLNGSLMFQRSVKGDRSQLAKKMRDHVHDTRTARAPLLVFPEGTCVNNEFTVLFQRGAFAMDAIVCPVAIKYSKKYGDPYWVSAKQSFVQHILYLMSFVELEVDVWWLEPQTIRPDENPFQFASRVKQSISETAGLINLSWDGYLKNFFTQEKKTRLLANQQQDFADGIKKCMQRGPVSSMDDDDEDAASRKSQTRTKSYNNLQSLRMSFMHFPDSLSTSQVVAIKNSILVRSHDNHQTIQELRRMNAKKEDVVHTWRKFTRIKNETEESAENRARRLENSSWRLWYKQSFAKRRAVADETLRGPPIVAS